ncbi:hypothetical protein GN244_ATG14231 [Phytophthora infestans]|uniref:Uncharacterized protein n=1 Tax=Phytophthora infestans TaxID=4787 RepID=A0A833SKA3_PHYIN|nr:hypothetical protein GN244_ATG14231 [Phytophthora infestans]KAF4143972.1 hypothetical protein GN958_ATG06827 [Phytophthora infestans]
MATRGKPSVFSAFNQLRVSEDFDSDDGSAEERHQERKEKQKQKKKSRNKKKSSDSAQLKDLAFVSVSKPKKSKNKKNKSATNVQPQSPTGSTGEEVPATNSGREAKEEATEPMRSLAAMIRATSQPQKTATVCNGVEKNPHAADQQQQHKKATSPPKQQQPQQKPQQQTAAPPQAPVVAPAASVVQSSSETELGAVYAPSHITITRVDGQMKRTVAVTEVMDQLLRYTQQNAQLLMVQEQLGHANRNLQDQLQSSAEIINGLQNEVTMFRQMCLNLQAEVSLLRSSTTVSTAPDAGSNPQPQHHRPPPGMS